MQPDNTERLLSRQQSGEEPVPDAENQHRTRSKRSTAPQAISEREWVSQQS